MESKRLTYLSFWVDVAFFLGDALDEHVNTLLSLGINRRHEPLRATNARPVISIVDTPEVNTFKVRTLWCP